MLIAACKVPLVVLLSVFHTTTNSQFTLHSRQTKIAQRESKFVTFMSPTAMLFCCKNYHPSNVCLYDKWAYDRARPHQVLPHFALSLPRHHSYLVFSPAYDFNFQPHLKSVNFHSKLEVQKKKNLFFRFTKPRHSFRSNRNHKNVKPTVW